MRHLVIGAGEVGTAVHAVLSDARPVAIRDVEPAGDIGPVDVLETCIPWSPAFVDQVRAYQAEYGAELVVVHSTVPVGTCDAEGWVHSPVRGRHPNLVPGLRAFTKHFGGREAARAAEAWADAGVITDVHPRAAELEAGKVWELVQFGVQVRTEQAIHAWCEQRGLDPDVVYRQMAETYNAGYQQLGERCFVRPVLDHVPGPIGGHCVVPMSHLLDHPIAEIVREGW